MDSGTTVASKETETAEEEKRRGERGDGVGTHKEERLT